MVASEPPGSENFVAALVVPRKNISRSAASLGSPKPSVTQRSLAFGLPRGAYFSFRRNGSKSSSEYEKEKRSGTGLVFDRQYF